MGAPLPNWDSSLDPLALTDAALELWRAHTRMGAACFSVVHVVHQDVVHEAEVQRIVAAQPWRWRG